MNRQLRLAAFCLAVLVGVLVGLHLPSFWWIDTPPNCTVLHAGFATDPTLDLTGLDYDAGGWWTFDSTGERYGWSAQEDTTIYAGKCVQP